MNTEIKNNESEKAELLYKFEVTKGILRFFLIFSVFWLINSLEIESKKLSLKALPLALFMINLLYLVLLLVFKTKLIKSPIYLKVFHYISLVLCPLVFIQVIRFTGYEDSIFVAFFYFYLTVIPLAQIYFNRWETWLSEAFIVASYPLFLTLFGKIRNHQKVLWQVGFELVIAATILVFYEIIKRENSKMVELTNNLYNLSIKDYLTGLYNRRFFFEIVSKELEKAERKETVFSLAIGDFDNFKQVNDEYGHAEGDKVLKLVSEIIKASIRKMDVAARLGGEEFVILLPETSKVEACKMLERLKERIKNESKKFSKIPITISFGIASYPEDGKTIDEILKRADRALYEAKRQGKDRIQACAGMVG